MNYNRVGISERKKGGKIYGTINYAINYAINDEYSVGRTKWSGLPGGVRNAMQCNAGSCTHVSSTVVVVLVLLKRLVPICVFAHLCLGLRVRVRV